MAILTSEQLETIKNHKYVAGTYTPIDNILNPMWLKLTTFLPLWMAPNLVTLLGWFHMIFLWSLITSYAPTAPDWHTPCWVLLLAAWCLMVYQTMDAMDGKQARRTGASSPLGQLFDHGCDATTVFLVIHSVTSVAGLSGSPFQIVVVMMGIFTFFIAQWQEYHLHVLPHAVGPFGVTEQQLMAVGIFVVSGVLGPSMWHISFGVCSLSTVFVCGQLAVMVFCSFDSVRKVLAAKGAGSTIPQLASPILLLLLTVFWPSASVEAAPILVSLGASIAATHLSCKMIVFSMAHAPFSPMQLEVLPVAAAWLVETLQLAPSSAVLGLSTAVSMALFSQFIWMAISELCLHLQINCFTIGKAKAEDAPAPLASPTIQFPPGFKPRLQCEAPVQDDSQPPPSPSQVL